MKIWQKLKAKWAVYRTKQKAVISIVPVDGVFYIRTDINKMTLEELQAFGGICNIIFTNAGLNDLFKAMSGLARTNDDTQRIEYVLNAIKQVAVDRPLIKPSQVLSRFGG